MRALAAAKNQQRWLVRRRSGWNSEKFLPHRNADDLRIAEIAGRLFEMDRRCGHAFSHHLVGESGDVIRLKSQRGNLSENGRCHCRTGGVTTHADHYVRLKNL